MYRDCTRHMVIEKDIGTGMNYENTLRSCQATAVWLPGSGKFLRGGQAKPVDKPAKISDVELACFVLAKGGDGGGVGKDALVMCCAICAAPVGPDVARTKVCIEVNSLQLRVSLPTVHVTTCDRATVAGVAIFKFRQL